MTSVSKQISRKYEDFTSLSLSETETNKVGKEPAVSRDGRSGLLDSDNVSPFVAAAPSPPVTDVLKSEKVPPKSESGADRRKKRKKPIEYAVNPEDDPEYTCCCGWNLHNSTLILIILTFVMWAVMMAVSLYFYEKRLHALDAAVNVAMSSISMGSYIFLMVGNRLRIPWLYIVYAAVSVRLAFLLLYRIQFIGAMYTFLVTIGTIQLATVELLHVSRDVPFETQKIVTRQNIYRMILAFVTWLVCVAHIWTWYVVYRDWNFVRTYPLRRKNYQISEIGVDCGD